MAELKFLRVLAHNGAEFFDETDAALGSLGGIAEFKSEAGHGTEMRGRIAPIHVIEQGGANVVDRTDVDPGLSVGEAIDASPRRGVLPD